MTRPTKPTKEARFYRADARLPPRFVAAWFSDQTVGVEIVSDTVRAWRKRGFFGPRAQQATSRYRFSWEELFAASGAWSPTGSFAELQRRPYSSEVVAARLGLSHKDTLERFRRRKIPGGFKIGVYWYARAAEFDAEGWV